MKTLLVAVCLFVGQSVWGTETNATLDHTASVKGGSNATAGTVDQEQEYYNNDATSGWIGWAFAQFSFSLPEGENITKAELTWKATSGKGYGTSIYYLNAGTSIDYEALTSVTTATDYRFNGSKTSIETAGSVNGGVQYTTDVTNAIKSVVNESQSYIIFQFTGNAGGANLYGKSSSFAPTLVITTTAETTYAVTFTETNDVAATVKIGGTDVTSGTSLVNGTYDFTATATGYQDYAGSFTVAGADKEVSFTMTAKSVYNYTVKAVDGDDNSLGTVGSGSGYADESVTYYYPEFVLNGTTLYKVNQEKFISKSYWCNTGTLDSADKEFTITYGDGTISNVVFYKEAEDMDGFTAKTTNNATTRCSAGTGGISTSAVPLITLPAGKYAIFGQVWGTSGMTATVKAGDKTVWEQSTTGSLASNTSDEFELLETTELTVVTTGGSDNRMLDLIYITGTPTNEIVGAIDCSTGYLGAVSEKKTLNAGEAYTYKFVNHNGNGTQTWYNYLVPVYVSGANPLTLRADNWVVGPGSNTGCSNNMNWTDFNTHMDGATVDLTVMYTSDKKFQAYATITSADATPETYKYFYDGSSYSFDAESIEVALGVEKAWLEIVSESSSATLPFEVSEAGWATFYTPFAIDLSGVTAYTATVSESTVTLTPATEVPAYTGIVVKANEGSYSIPVLASSSAEQGDLKGLVAWNLDYDENAENDYFMLALNASNEAQFTKLTSGTIAAGKAYLQLAKDSYARDLKVVFADDETTGIHAVESGKLNVEGYYNLNGQRVAQPSKGLYIVNGKKVVVK